MLQQSKCEVSKARAKAVRVQKKGVCLSHVPKYHWLPGLGRKKGKEAKVTLRFLARIVTYLLCDREPNSFGPGYFALLTCLSKKFILSIWKN